MMKSNELWSTLQAHWKTYVAKNHKYSYLCDVTDESAHDDDVASEEDDDGDCIVHLAGDDNESLDVGIDDDWADSEAQGRAKRIRVEPV